MLHTRRCHAKTALFVSCNLTTKPSIQHPTRNATSTKQKMYRLPPQLESQHRKKQSTYLLPPPPQHLRFMQSGNKRMHASHPAAPKDTFAASCNKSIHSTSNLNFSIDKAKQNSIVIISSLAKFRQALNSEICWRWASAHKPRPSTSGEFTKGAGLRLRSTAYYSGRRKKMGSAGAGLRHARQGPAPQASSPKAQGFGTHAKLYALFEKAKFGTHANAQHLCRAHQRR